MSLQSSGLSLHGSANIEDIIASEKEVWSKEKLTLQKALKRAEAKACELKAELRNDAVPQNRSPDSENAIFKVHTSLLLTLMLTLLLTTEIQLPLRLCP